VTNITANVVPHRCIVCSKAMTTRKITIIALTGGIVIGAAATEGFNVYRQSHDSQIFQERLRCKAMADEYVKKKSDKDCTDDSARSDGITMCLDLIPGQVDYSPARNSCVAGVETTTVIRGSRPILTETVEDLLSGETLFSAKCTKDCEVLEWTFVKDAFDYVRNNASEPIEVQKAVDTYLESSKSPPKLPAPSGDASGWKPVQEPASKSPPQSAPPSGH
jgi:hypothetical protein